MKRKRDEANTSSKRRRTGDAPVTAKVAKLEKQIRVLSKTEEVKQQLQALAGNVAIASGYALTSNCCTRITQGIAANQRIGAKITCLGLHMKFRVQTRSIEYGEPTIVRVIIFIDKQPITGSADPPLLQTVNAPDGLLLNGTGTIATCPNNYVSRKRYKKLYDKVIVINPQTVLDYDPVTGNTTAMYPESRVWQKWINLRNLPVQYNGVAGTADQIANNNLWVCQIQQATPLAAGWYTDSVSALYFKDA